MKQKLVYAILILSLIGFVISLYSLLHNTGFVAGSFCTIDEVIDCDIVNKGSYSQIAGIPVALIGVLGYLFLVIGAIAQVRQPSDRHISKFLCLASAAGVLFSFYLTGLEAFVLHAWCLLCISSQAIILAIFVLTTVLIHKKNV